MANFASLKKKRNSLGGAKPPELDEAGKNLESPEVAPISVESTPGARTRSNRTESLTLKLSPEFKKRLKTHAFEQECYIVDFLEKVVESWEKNNS